MSLLPSLSWQNDVEVGEDPTQDSSARRMKDDYEAHLKILRAEQIQHATTHDDGVVLATINKWLNSAEGCRHQSAKEEPHVREPAASGTPPSGPTSTLGSPQSETSELSASPLAYDDHHEIGIRSEPQG